MTHHQLGVVNKSVNAFKLQTHSLTHQQQIDINHSFILQTNN